MNTHTALRLLAASLLFSVACVWAQPADNGAEKGSDFEDNEGHRDNLVLIPDGSILLVTQPSDDVSGVVIQAADGTQSSVADPGECLGDCASKDPLDLQGVGSNPDMNDNGVVTFKGSFLHCQYPEDDPTKGIECAPEPKGNIDVGRRQVATVHGIFSGTPASLTTVAIAREFENGDSIDGDTFCDFEPMPRINENGQVFFGAHLDVAGGDALGMTFVEEGGKRIQQMCGGGWEFIDTGEQRKGIYRYTSGTTDTLLVTQADSNLTTIQVSDTNFVDSTTTFAITDTHLNTQGATLANNQGHVVAYGMFDDDPTDDCPAPVPNAKGSNSFECQYEEGWFFDDRMGLLYLRGENDRSLIALAGPPAESIFQEVREGAVNRSGQVVFKGQEGVQQVPDPKGGCAPGPGCITEPEICGIGEDFQQGCEVEEAGSSLNLWSNSLAKGVALNQFVQSGDSVPGSNANFGGFTKHADINDSGHVAFIGSIDLGGPCDEQGDPFRNPPEKGGDWTGDLCKGVYFYNGGFIQEVARTTTAAQLEPGNNVSSIDGFRFENIGAVAIINNQDKVVWTAENQDADPECGFAENEDGQTGFGGGERTGIFAWTPEMGYAKIIQEGDEIEQGRVIRLFTPQPELRQHLNDQGTFVIRLWVDSTNGCSPDEEVILSVVMLPPSEIPALAPWALLLLAGLFGIGGVTVLRRKAT